MKSIFILLSVIPIQLVAQGGSDTLRLQDLVLEALRNNPELKAAEYSHEMMDERANQAGIIDNPELAYVRDEMPGFRWNEAMYAKVQLMQMIRFPGKLSLESDIADIQAEHAHHDFMEKANDLLARLRSAYFELWYAQRSLALNRENARLLRQFTAIAQTRYGVGVSPQQDVLKAFVETAKLDNQCVALRQQELTAKSMLIAMLNRPPNDTLGYATLPDEVVLAPTLDTLQYFAGRFRGMLQHDSLSVEESEMMMSLAKKEYLPDFKLGLEYVTMPTTDFKGWSVSAGITLPFMPWSLSRTNSKLEEAGINIDRAKENYRNSRNMVRSAINEQYFKAQSLKQQLQNYAQVIVPQSRQALQASMTAYQTGKTDFLMLIDSYRMLVDLSMERLMLRMQFEQTVAELKRTVGYAGIFEPRNERNEP